MGAAVGRNPAADISNPVAATRKSGAHIRGAAAASRIPDRGSDIRELEFANGNSDPRIRKSLARNAGSVARNPGAATRGAKNASRTSATAVRGVTDAIGHREDAARNAVRPIRTTRVEIDCQQSDTRNAGFLTRTAAFVARNAGRVCHNPGL